MEQLLALGANLDVQDRFGGTPLDDALREGREEVIKVLLAEGARFDEDKIGVLLCSAGAEGDLARIKLMVRSGCNPNAPDGNLRTCLHLATATGQVQETPPCGPHPLRFVAPSLLTVRPLTRRSHALRMVNACAIVCTRTYPIPVAVNIP